MNGKKSKWSGAIVIAIVLSLVSLSEYIETEASDKKVDVYLIKCSNKQDYKNKFFYNKKGLLALGSMGRHCKV